MIDHLKMRNRKTHRIEIDPSSLDDIRRTLDVRGWHVSELPSLGDNVFEARPPESLLCYVYMPNGDTESPPSAVLAGGWSPPEVCDIAESTARLLKTDHPDLTPRKLRPPHSGQSGAGGVKVIGAHSVR